MNTAVLAGLMVPFFGTTLGSMMVFFMRKQLNERLNKMLTGFAAGVMVSASFWSLLIPAVEQGKELMGKIAVFPATIGFCLGMVFLLLIDTMTPHMHMDESVEGPASNLKNHARFSCGDTQYSGGYGSRCVVCRMDAGERSCVVYCSIIAGHWYCYPEFPGRSDYFYAPACQWNE